MYSRMWFAGTKVIFLDGLAVLPDVWGLNLNLIVAILVEQQNCVMNKMKFTTKLSELSEICIYMCFKLEYEELYKD